MVTPTRASWGRPCFPLRARSDRVACRPPRVRIAVLALCLLIVSTAAPSLASARDLRIGLVTPPPHVWTQVARRIATNLTAANPDIRPLVFPASQLGNEPEMF